MTSPIEAMAKAYWETRGFQPTDWSMVDVDTQASVIAGMRSSLLALAKAGLSQDLRKKAAAAMDESDEYLFIEVGDGFRLICRALAEEGKTE